MVESKTQSGGVRGWKQRPDGQCWQSGVWGGFENTGRPGLLSALQTAGDRPEASAGPGGRRPLLASGARPTFLKLRWDLWSHRRQS